MKKKIAENKYIWIAFLIGLIPRLLFLMKTYPISIGGDEMYAMWPAAKLLGYDWSGVMQEYRYYGYGFTILWVPFMALIKNPVALYRSMVALMALCQALIAPISFHLMQKYFQMKDEKMICLLSVSCSYLVAVRATYTYPEFVYVLVVWMIVWVQLKLTLEAVQEQRGQKALYTFLLFVTMAYAYTVHSRALALWGALAITVVLYFWIYRKFYLSIPICVIIGIPAFIGVKVGIAEILKFLGAGSVSEVGNTTAGTSLSVLELFKNPKSWTAWADIIIGQLNESLLLTGGIAAAIIVVICLVLWKALRRDEEIILKERVTFLPYVITGIFSISAIGITIGGQSITWLGGVTGVMESNSIGGSLRAITYLRYYGAYIGPLFMAGFIYIYQNSRVVEQFKGKIALIIGLLQGYWIVAILPVVCYESGCVWSDAPFSLTKGFAADSVGIRSYLPGTVFVIVFSVFAYQLLKREKTKAIIGLLCIILLYNYSFNGLYHERYRGEKNYRYSQSVVEWINKVEDSGVQLEKIYTAGDAIPEMNQSAKFQYQFLMPEKKVIAGIPDEKEAICISYHPEEILEELNGDYIQIKITEDAYAFVWGDELQEKIQSAAMID